MSSLSTSSKRKWMYGVGGLVVALGAGGYWLFGDCDVCYGAQTGTFTAGGSIPATCNIVVSTAGGTANNLTLEGSGTGLEVQAATVTATCNKKAGFKLKVSSLHCADLPGGVGSPAVGPYAKMLTDGVALADADWVGFWIKFTNATGAPATQDNLLKNGCTADPGDILGNTVTGKQTGGLMSTIYVKYDQVTAGSVSSGSYSDVVTITMTDAS